MSTDNIATENGYNNGETKYKKSDALIFFVNGKKVKKIKSIVLYLPLEMFSLNSLMNF